MKVLVSKGLGNPVNPYLQWDQVPVANGYNTEINPKWKEFEQNKVKLMAVDRNFKPLPDGEHEVNVMWLANKPTFEGAERLSLEQRLEWKVFLSQPLLYAEFYKVYLLQSDSSIRTQ